MAKKELSTEQQEELLGKLKSRFEKNMNRHEGVEWDEVQKKLEAAPDKLWSLFQMEETGGEPDVVTLDLQDGVHVFYDCSPETPKDRRSLCYDREAWEARKKFKPENTAMDMAAEMGIKMISEDEYRSLHQFGEFDRKTSTWVLTPENIRSHGGAIFCDYRYGQVFTYHNGADSYYASRGFRGKLEV
ncbi:DUF4256 domain-containing protein [Planococcus halotolerans]|uniref:DUF4256 domain-containing protein n=1 Tax=Planococcus halotolerans TaxID=2233542 RepID=A0A365KXF1_9BACL|nr:DUF4256 domain-containing protein [Planococcus halotolerans]QHJ72139.1 DUF4256 domain-containing protein [Planococcus halotolerans]RAZ77845.1 DUF4256 domain-containing protein [Planococcus halotolerans]